MNEGYAVLGRPGTGRRGDRRGAGVVVVLIVAFLGVAIAKPWATATPTTSGGSSAPSLVSEASLAPLPGGPAAAAVAPLPVAFTTPVPPPGAASWTGLHWQRLAPDDPLRLVTSIRRWPGGFVAIGRQDASPATPVWTSADGRHWRPLVFGSATTFWPGLDVLGIATVRTTLVALTEAQTYCGAPCVPTYILPIVSWTSGDGRRWTPHLLSPEWLPSPAGRAPLFADGAAGIIVASSGAAARLAASTDGANWQLLPAGAFPARFALDDLRGTPTGFVAVGRWMTSDSRSVAGSLWSSDGQHWSDLPTLLPATRTGLAVESPVTALVAGRAGMLAIGGGATPGATVWWQSADGRTWQVLPGDPPLGPTACIGDGCGTQPNGSLVGDGQRMVALRGGSTSEAWVSSDGRSWRRLAMRGEVPTGQATQVVLLPGGVLLRDEAEAWFGTAIVR
jgi:hypothetical protein